ncbi:MAG: chemotaxis protein CheA [Chitinispirillales bacterium]|nr:chemotaxis protein CheA [Chitinispirillales bacterium]
MSSDESRKELDKIEEISAALVLVDPSDNQAMAVGIHSKFQELHDCTDDAGAKATALSCIDMVEKIIFQEMTAVDGMKALADALTTLRRKMLYGDDYDAPKDGAESDAFVLDDEEEKEAANKAAAVPVTPLVQDNEGFYVDTVAAGKSTGTAAFRREIDIATLDTALLGEFIAEAEEHLANSDDALLRLESSPSDVDIINELFRAFHTIKGVAGFLSLDAIQALTHSTESLMDKAREKVFVLTRPAVDLVFSTVDVLKSEMHTLKNSLQNGTPYVVQEIMDQIIYSVDAMLEALLKGGGGPKIGDMLVVSGKVSKEELHSALKEQEHRPDTKVGQILVDRGAVTPGDISTVLDKQSIVTTGKPAAPTAAATIVKESVKVDTDKLDRLVDMIGELVITEAMVTGELSGGAFQSSRLGANARQLSKITRQLQEIGLSMRMMSLKATFNKMARLVRDLARQAGKEINFVSIGEDTELDKSVIEHISDPLVHMIRNSADHGLEMPDDREVAGKSRVGTVTLKAYQKGGSICIEIQDDGKGLNRSVILKKAIDKGIVEAGAQLTDNEINHLIFAPGFSTAAQVTNISGRGVGMDVVRRNVEALRGRIEIHSTLGVGTTFIIHLPLTLAIMDGMVVMASGERYILPTFSVVENFKPTADDLTDVMGAQKVVMCHNQLLPLYNLAEVMGKRSTTTIENGIVMVVEDAGRRTGLLVDKIIGQQQTVIKKLGDGVGKINGISGGAIMPDGRVSLIVDVAETVRMSTTSSMPDN